MKVSFKFTLELNHIGYNYSNKGDIFAAIDNSRVWLETVIF